MTILIAGLVDLDFRTFVLAAAFVIAIAAGLVIYLASRRLTGGQWFSAGCFYLSVVLFFAWFTEVRVPDSGLDNAFRSVQPFLSIVLVVAALVAARKQNSFPKPDSRKIKPRTRSGL